MEKEPETLEPGVRKRQLAGTFAQFSVTCYARHLTDAIKDDATARPFTPDTA